MSELLSVDDVQVMQRIRQREQGALVELYHRYRKLVYNMALHVLRDNHGAEEVTQDIFFQIWRWPERWDPNKGRFTSWLLSVTRYTAIDRLRKDRRQPTLIPNEPDDISGLYQQKALFDDAQRDDGRLLRALIKQLPKEQQQVILLAFFRGMTHSEIATQLNLPVGTVKSRIRLGLEKLKTAWLAAIRHEKIDLP